MQVRFANAVAKPLMDPIKLRPRRRRLDRIVRHWTQGIDVPFVVSIHRPGEPLVPSNDNVRIRPGAIPKGIKNAERKLWEERLWSRTMVERNQVVQITLLPAGGGGGSSVGKIAMTVAAVALAAFAGPLAGVLANAMNISNAFAIAAIQAGITIGGAALLMAFSRRNEDNKPVFGVSGGGNLPRPNDRIQIGYGVCWGQPDLSQPDYYRYENTTDTILIKRMTIGLGKYRVRKIRVGSTLFYNGATLDPNSGIVTDTTDPFPNCKFEIIYEAVSEIAPKEIITSPSVSGQNIPLSDNPSPTLGPFAVNPVGTTINRIQVDYSTPGYQKNQHETTQDLWFEYVECDDFDEPLGAWQTLYRTSAPMFAKKFLKYSQSVIVPEGRYLVRAKNNVPEEPNSSMIYTWDGLRGFVPEDVIRPNVTEIAMEIRSGEGLQVTSFNDVMIEVERIGEVYDEELEAMVDDQPIVKCVDVAVDALHNSDYGGDVPLARIDLDKAVAYRDVASGFDEFNGFLRGPMTLHDFLTQVYSNMRAEPVRVGAAHSFVRDEPTALRRHVFSRDEIDVDSVEIEEVPKANEGESDVIIEYLREGDPKRRETVRATYGTASLTPRRISWPGIRTPQHATHLARWFAAAGYYRRTNVTFNTDLGGRVPQRGQPIMVDPWFVETRETAAVKSMSGLTVTTDLPMIPEADWRAIFRTEDGLEWGPIRVTAGDSDRELVLNEDDVEDAEIETGVSRSNVVVDDDGKKHLTTVIMGPLADLGTVWLMRSMTPGEEFDTTLNALIDAPEVYTAIGEAIPDVSPLTWGLPLAEAPEITEVDVEARNQTSDVHLVWGLRAQAGAVRYQVLISYVADDAAYEEIYSGPSPMGSAPVLYNSTDPTLHVIFRAYGATGLSGPEVRTSVEVPAPIVTATTPWDSIETSMQAGLTKIVSDIAAAREITEQLAASVQALEQAVQDGAQVSIDNMKSVRGSATAELESVRVVLANDTTALTIRMDTAESTLGDYGSAITTLETTKVDAAGATAAATTVVEARFGEEGEPGSIEASVEEIAAVTITPTGTAALHSILLNVAGYISGIKNLNNGTTSLVEILADIFSIRDPGTGDVVLSWDGINDVLSIFGATFVAGRIESVDGRFIIDLVNKLITIKDASDVIVLRLGYY